VVGRDGAHDQRQRDEGSGEVHSQGKCLEPSASAGGHTLGFTDR
jgi:hypothetical protein